MSVMNPPISDHRVSALRDDLIARQQLPESDADMIPFRRRAVQTLQSATCLYDLIHFLAINCGDVEWASCLSAHNLA